MKKYYLRGLLCLTIGFIGIISSTSISASSSTTSPIQGDCKESIVFLQADGTRTLTIGDILTTPCVGCTIDIVGDLTTVVDCSVAGKSVVVQITPPNGIVFYCTVQVEDVTPPSLICPDIMVGCHLDVFLDPIDSFGVSAMDNCEIDSLYPLLCGSEPGDCIDTLKKLKILWQAVDKSGNLASCTQFISYPVLSTADVVCPADDTVYCEDPDISNLDVPMIHDSLGFSKNCGLILSEPTLDTIDLCGSEKWIKRQWTIFDPCTWQRDTCVQSIMILDTIGPMIACPMEEDTIYLDTTDVTCSHIYEIPGFDVTHNCPEDSTSFTAILYNGNVYNTGHTVQLDSGRNEFLFVAGDACWKLDTCEFYVELIDTIDLLLSCPIDSLCIAYDESDRLALATLSNDSLNTLFGFPMVENTSVCCPFDSFQITNTFFELLAVAPGDTLLARKFVALDSCGLIQDSCVQKIYHKSSSRQESRFEALVLPAEVSVGVDIWPNPMKSNLSVQITLSLEEEIVVELVDLLGRSWYSETYKGMKGVNILDLDVSKIPPGMTYLKLSADSFRKTELILKI